MNRSIGCPCDLNLFIGIILVFTPTPVYVIFTWILTISRLRAPGYNWWKWRHRPVLSNTTDTLKKQDSGWAIPPPPPPKMILRLTSGSWKRGQPRNGPFYPSYTKRGVANDVSYCAATVKALNGGSKLVFTWRHGGHGVSNQSWSSWTLFLCKCFLLFQYFCIDKGHVSESAPLTTFT